jgi:hypothetical protein
MLLSENPEIIACCWYQQLEALGPAFKLEGVVCFTEGSQRGCAFLQCGIKIHHTIVSAW